MARPREEEEILSIRLAKRHVEMLDEYISCELQKLPTYRAGHNQQK